MGRYTEFTLYWETWGGYPDRAEPFGLPQLTWFVASADSAARCVVRSQPEGSMGVTWSAEWQQLPRELLAPVPGLLEEAGAFGEPAPLVVGDAPGDYLVVWELTGALRDRPFRLSVQHKQPGCQWTPLGQRLSDSLHSLQAYQPGRGRRR
jgi:hypothetical protein